MSGELTTDNDEPSMVLRAQWFLDQQIISPLSQGVAQAEKARQKGDHQAVHHYFDTWVGEDQKDKKTLRVVAYYKKRVPEVDLIPKEDLIKAGLAGLGRIEHVDANSEYKEIKDIIRLARRRDQVLELYERLDPENLVPWTIHGGSIYWPAEIAQDGANTAIILGDFEEAEKILSKALAKIHDVNSQARGIDFQTPEGVLKAENYSAYKARKKFVGAISAKGVLWYRKALISQKLEEMVMALRYTHKAHHLEPNSQRLTTISFKALQSSLSPEFSGKLSTRSTCLSSSLLGLTLAYMGSPKDTISSIKQALHL